MKGTFHSLAGNLVQVLLGFPELLLVQHWLLCQAKSQPPIISCVHQYASPALGAVITCCYGLPLEALGLLYLWASQCIVYTSMSLFTASSLRPGCPAHCCFRLQPSRTAYSAPWLYSGYSALLGLTLPLRLAMPPGKIILDSMLCLPLRPHVLCSA